MLFQQVNRAAKSTNYTLSAPIGGLNARDSLDTMGALDAIVMDNYIPLDTRVALRKGFVNYVTTDHPVPTLAEYKSTAGNKFLAVSNGKCYNITTKSSVVEYDAIFTNSRCQTVQYKDRLFFMNGADTPKVFYLGDNNTEILEDWGFSGTNLTATKIIAGAVSKNFLWFIERDTLKVWYSATAGNISGTLNAFDLSGIARLGGKLVAVACWTQDGGQGIDDLTVFITSEGEALVYAGINPNSADSWILKGSYRISKPIGYNCTMQYQGDIIVISEDGYIPLSRALPKDKANASQVSFSDKIRGLVLDRTQTNKDKKGWQGILYGRGGYAIFNVPSDNQYEQHVINVNTGAWCRFTNIRSMCWCIFKDRIYFGSDKGVYLFDEGYSDDGMYIAGNIEQAFSNLGTPNLKKIQLLNPRTKSSTRYALVIYTNMDFEEQNISYIQNIGNAGMTKWNEAKWSCLANPIGTKWATLKGKARSQWIANSATGFKASIVFKTKTKGNLIEWFDTGIRFEQGTGII